MESDDAERNSGGDESKEATASTNGVELRCVW